MKQVKVQLFIACLSRKCFCSCCRCSSRATLRLTWCWVVSKNSAPCVFFSFFSPCSPPWARQCCFPELSGQCNSCLYSRRPIGRLVCSDFEGGSLSLSPVRRGGAWPSACTPSPPSCAAPRSPQVLWGGRWKTKTTTELTFTNKQTQTNTHTQTIKQKQTETNR